MGQDHHDLQLRDGQAARLGGARSGTAGRDQSVWRDRRCSSRGPENAERPCGALRLQGCVNAQILTSIEERGWKKGIQQGMQASQAEVWRKAKLEDAREMRAAQLDLDLI